MVSKNFEYGQFLASVFESVLGTVALSARFTIVPKMAWIC